MARSFSDCKVFSYCIGLSDLIELSSSKMFLICHKANNYAALIFVFIWKLCILNLVIFILSLLNPKIIQLVKNFF